MLIEKEILYDNCSCACQNLIIDLGAKPMRSQPMDVALAQVLGVIKCKMKENS